VTKSRRLLSLLRCRSLSLYPPTLSPPLALSVLRSQLRVRPPPNSLQPQPSTHKLNRRNLPPLPPRLPQLFLASDSYQTSWFNLRDPKAQQHVHYYWHFARYDRRCDHHCESDGCAQRSDDDGGHAQFTIMIDYSTFGTTQCKRE
jgi:hypothetical protein